MTILASMRYKLNLYFWFKRSRRGKVVLHFFKSPHTELLIFTFQHVFHFMICRKGKRNVKEMLTNKMIYNAGCDRVYSK